MLTADQYLIITRLVNHSVNVLQKHLKNYILQRCFCVIILDGASE